jgi:acyl carrier protein
MDVEKSLNEIFIEEKMGKQGEITLDTPLSSFKMDSLGLVELLMKIEDKFSIEFPAEELEGLNTVGELVAKIKEKV